MGGCEVDGRLVALSWMEIGHAIVVGRRVGEGFGFLILQVSKDRQSVLPV